MKNAARTTITTLATALTLLGAVAPLGGCRGGESNKPPRQFMPGMDDSPRYSTQGESTFFDDHRMMRQPVEGTVAYGRILYDDWNDRADLLREDDAVFRGKHADGGFVRTMPVRVADLDRDGGTSRDEVLAFIERGRERYNIYCITCHGGTGEGDGAVGERWSMSLPSFHDPKYRDRDGAQGADGYIFDIIRNGLRNPEGVTPEYRMPAYGSQINERDAWAVVAYLRTLQESRLGTQRDLTAEQRTELRRSSTNSAGTAEGGS